MTTPESLSLSAASLLEHLTRAADSRCWKYKQTWFSQVREIAAKHHQSIDGANILEIGAGVHNPLGSAILAILQGARGAVAVEPSRLSGECVRDAISTLLVETAEQQRWAHFPQALFSELLRLERLGSRLSTVVLSHGVEFFNRPFEAIAAPGIFDLIHSNAVLEHVLDMDRFLRHLRGSTSSSALQVHKVDFVDHDWYDNQQPTDADCFNFLLQENADAGCDCNKLRLCQMVERFEANGFQLVAIEERWTKPFPPHYLPRLAPRFAGCSLESLQTTGSILVFRNAPR